MYSLPPFLPMASLWHPYGRHYDEMKLAHLLILLTQQGPGYQCDMGLKKAAGEPEEYLQVV